MPLKSDAPTNKEIVIEGFASKVEPARKAIVKFLEKAKQENYKKLKLSDLELNAMMGAVNIT